MDAVGGVLVEVVDTFLAMKVHHNLKVGIIPPQLIWEPTLEVHYLRLIVLKLFFIILKERVTLHVFVPHLGIQMEFKYLDIPLQI